MKVDFSLAIRIVLLFFLFTSAMASYGQHYLEMIERGGYPVYEIQEEAERYFADKDKGKGSGYKQYKRWEYEAHFNQDEEGYLRTDQDNYRAILRRDQMLNQQLGARNDMCTGDWQELGPIEVDVSAGYNPGIGRVTSFSIDPSDENHMIIGAQTGGVWRTEDGGSTWVPLSDRFPNMEVYALLIDPSDSDTYYWGGSSGFFFVSEDRGATWQDRSIPGGSTVVSIRWHEMTNTLWAAASWKGLYRSDDGGASWTAEIPDLRVLDIEFHPTDDAVIYASGERLWISQDAGMSFSQVADQTLDPGAGVYMMAVSLQAPDHLYVLQESDQAFNGLYLSRDQGASFSILQQPDVNYLGYDINGLDDRGQAPRDMDIVVDPADTNFIYLGGINIWRSRNGGRTFHIVSHWFFFDNMESAYSHADTDIMQWYDGKLFIGSDGGFYVMDDPKVFDVTDAIRYVSKGVGITQFYRIGIRQSEEVVVSGGTQDNGTNILKDGRWSHWYGADGMETFFVDFEFIDQYTWLFGTSQFGNMVRSLSFGEEREDVPGLQDIQSTGDWVTPFMRDPSGESIYVCYDTVYRSDDYGDNFEPISGFLDLTTMSVAPTGEDTLYGASFERMYRTFDGGRTRWEDIFLPDNGLIFSVNTIAVHPRDASMVAIGTNGGARVYLSRDGGDTWTPYGEGLPDFNPRTLVWRDDDFETLYAGMNYGIYRIDRTMSMWMPFDFGLPNVIVNDLHINEVRDELYAGTYGRGLWVSPLCDPPVSTDDFAQGAGMYIDRSLIQAGDVVTLTSDESLQASISVHRVDGQMVHYDRAVRLGGDYRIPSEHWSSGMHIIRVQHSAGYQTFKVIVQ